ncbi:hypothetical protein ATEIFO6365_0012025800 [Aspergillus terreus]|uniref:Rhodopsin domain-containing protein n=1 Tax=Aspergillus terreus TaxID=33178 RepID=A0A5M3ZBX2_ASPTE|nr:hypothetical protein ATETN484_0013026800 [Aspergillus terreus]GFF20502.1 hypothetical protein ATEIFO6365_0012025800 [Aspergillus terreus]
MESMPKEVNNAGKQYNAAIVAIVLCAVSTILVFLRFVEKIRLRAVSAEDYVLIPGFLIYIATAAILIRANIDGALGTPIQQVTYHQADIVGQSALLIYWLYAPMSGFIRVSILLFYRRLFSPTMPILGIVIWILLVAQVLFTIAGLILPAVGPKPLYRMWHLRDMATDDNPQLSSQYSYDIGMSTFSINLALDVILLILPLFPIAALRLPIRKKLGMAVLFILGAGACFAAAWKLAAYITELSDQTDPSRLAASTTGSGKGGVYIPAESTVSGETLSYFYATQLEPALAIIGTSLPAIRQLICSFRKPSPQSSQEMEESSSRRYHRRWLQLHHTPTSERALTTDMEQQGEMYLPVVEDDREHGL